MSNTNYIAFTVNAELRNELLSTNEVSRVVVLPIEEGLSAHLHRAAAKQGLNAYKVLRALVGAYLLVRKSHTEDPMKGLRAMVRSWLKKVRKGQRVNLTRYSTGLAL
ncbi:hypothetical protein [Variovorax sp. W2I14]|uniref:hypothetical protein n=1 Tax=Variovorax sp. W2I14 TaxID=3042290 RepID=UPI003D208800